MYACVVCVCVCEKEKEVDSRVVADVDEVVDVVRLRLFKLCADEQAHAAQQLEVVAPHDHHRQAPVQQGHRQVGRLHPFVRS